MRVGQAVLFVVSVVVACWRLVVGDCCGDLARIGFQSSLPVIVMDTWGGWIPDEPKIDGSMCTCAPSGNYNGRMRVEIRGSTSARDFQKKSYAVETTDDQGKDLKTDLLGFPADSDWVLYGPEMDKSLGLRNILAYRLARQTGQYASRTQYCEVFVVSNGASLDMSHYNGVYVLGEKIKKGQNRVNIENIGDDLSGGFIWKHDNNNIDDGDRTFWMDKSQINMIMTYPKRKKVTDDQIGSLQNYLRTFEEQLFARGDYQQYIDMGSFIDYFLITEITKNPDGYRGSTYMHKNKYGPIRMGPAWDYNEAFGQCCGYPIEGYSNGGSSSGQSGGSAISTNGWRFNICSDQYRCNVDPKDGVSQWYRIMWEDAGFRTAVANRWKQLRGGSITDGLVRGVVSDSKNQVWSAVSRNHDRWGLNSEGEWSADVSQIESWTLGRLAWMDSQLNVYEPSFLPDGSGSPETVFELQSSNTDVPESPPATAVGGGVFLKLAQAVLSGL